jgi:hypothetical protein
MGAGLGQWRPGFLALTTSRYFSSKLSTLLALTVWTLVFVFALANFLQELC